MVYYYVVIYNNNKLSQMFSSQKKCTDYILTLGDLTANFTRFLSKREANTFISKTVISDTSKQINTLTEKEKIQQMTEFLLKKKKKQKKQRNKITQEEIDLYNKKITEYDDGFVPDYYVYTDGACKRNGEVGAVAGYGIYFSQNDKRNISEKITENNVARTNNAAELSALIRVYEIIKLDILNGKNITIVTDSTYSIQCATTYGLKCLNNNWVGNEGSTIPNLELVKAAFNIYSQNSLVTNHVRLRHIMSHTKGTDVHSVGNHEADKLAVKGAVH
jgi:ribonuclease HI